jgi:hypothetical protein
MGMGTIRLVDPSSRIRVPNIYWYVNGQFWSSGREVSQNISSSGEKRSIIVEWGGPA